MISSKHTLFNMDLILSCAMMREREAMIFFPFCLLLFYLNDCISQGHQIILTNPFLYFEHLVYQVHLKFPIYLLMAYIFPRVLNIPIATQCLG